MNYKVKLTYYKASGKWYSDAECISNKEGLWEIWEEIRYMQHKGDLPGLVAGAKEYHIVIDVPEHPHAHPHLILLPVSEQVKALEERLK